MPYISQQQRAAVEHTRLPYETAGELTRGLWRVAINWQLYSRHELRLALREEVGRFLAAKPVRFQTYAEALGAAYACKRELDGRVPGCVVPRAVLDEWAHNLYV